MGGSARRVARRFRQPVLWLLTRCRNSSPTLLLGRSICSSCGETSWRQQFRWRKRDVLAPTFPPDACWSLHPLGGGLAPPSCRTCSAHRKKGTLTKPGCPDRQNREV